ncbi:hypothetical protein [Bacillus sp. FJAT-29937]|uniref:hypothetical protein n=1 Tax=Bacillus sp. FJAT-29937 TaxID=1720553 RepID=UPI00082F7675|nr:hypothetical protein [Bacillus sp. FJAT-29937]
MAKKALINTFIFTLIIINLIIWPMLFNEFKEGNKVAGEKGKYTILQESITDSRENDSDSEVVEIDEEDEDFPKVDEQNENNFKILRIE